MPVMRLCQHPGCMRKIPVNQSFCEEHIQEHLDKEKKRKEWLAQGNHSEFKDLYQSSKWRSLKRTALKEQPYCQCCGSPFDLEVDHIEPHRGNPGLFFDPDNLQVLCHRCHWEKTHQEIEERKLQNKLKKAQKPLWY